MKLPIFTVDAFTAKPFAGNPAAVIILQEPIKVSIMQSIADEINLAETAFVMKEKDKPGFSLRWMTPVMEVDLCGHATLATSHVLWQQGICPENEPILYHTRSGELTAVKRGKEIELNFPAIPQKQIKYPPELIAAIGGVQPKYVGMTKWNYIIELENEDAVRNLKPDYNVMLGLPGWGTIITALADEGNPGGFDFISRFFAPEKGIQEDPVTGSAHCALGPYWAGRLGRTDFKAYQASPRGGVLGLRVEGDRIFLTGNAVSVISGEIEIPE